MAPPSFTAHGAERGSVVEGNTSSSNAERDDNLGFVCNGRDSTVAHSFVHTYSDFDRDQCLPDGSLKGCNPTEVE